MLKIQKMKVVLIVEVKVCVFPSLLTLLNVLDDLKVNLLFEYFPNDKNFIKMFEITTLIKNHRFMIPLNFLYHSMADTQLLTLTYFLN